MRLSLIIAAHNEGSSLWKTVQSCVETCAGLDYEIVIADDASWDGCVDETRKRFPQVRIVRQDHRLGPSPTKDLGARHARGNILLFLDGHTKPEPGAIRRLAESVEWQQGNAIVTPAISGLDVCCWKSVSGQVGHGYFLELERFDCGWLPLSDLKKTVHRGRVFYESPAAIGCAFAVHRELYDDLRGFDPHMRSWGVEDLDFSLKCWLMGHPILHDPEAVVAHRFRKGFDNFHVPIQDLIVNQLRMAHKNFTPAVWREWVERCRSRYPNRLPDHPEGLWAYAWELFEERRESAEAERAYLMFRRRRDEFWYAERFGLPWPRLQGLQDLPSVRAFETLVQASPSPPPCGCKILRNGEEITAQNRNLLPGEKNVLSISCGEGTITDVEWTIPGSIFKNWEGSKTEGKLTAVPADDLKATPIEFYWIDSAENREVQVSFKLNGKACKETAKLNIKPLSVEYVGNPPPMLEVRIETIANKKRVGLLPDGVTPGIRLGANVI